MIRPLLLPALLVVLPGMVVAQAASGDAAKSGRELQQQVDKLAAMLAQEESALKESQARIDELHRQVAALQANLPGARNDPPASAEQEAGDAAGRLESQVSALREQQELQQSEIATHEQAKVESGSKFPVKLTGLILMNGFFNSMGVDSIQTPTVALGGDGTAGFSLRQTVLGLDARGPHLFGAASSGDVRADFFGSASTNSYASGGVARLRTAHAELDWSAARAFVALDRPIVNPNTPSSLTAVAVPGLAWSGNLWNWIPQLGGEYGAGAERSRFVIQAALADVPNPAQLNSNVSVTPNASQAEQSRRPGSEARIGYGYGDKTTGLQVGLGGYYSPHRGDDYHYDAWAATFDYRIPVTRFFELSGNAYRGAALGGLGAGTFKDYVWRRVDDSYHALDDAGGWGQVKARLGERFELNEAYGIDNAFAGEVRPYISPGAGWYQNLARNATVTSNMIYSPTAYTLFSFEYRRIESRSAAGNWWNANVYGVAAGYRF